MAEDGRKERGKGRTIFIWERKNDSSITWESKMLHAIQQVAFFPTQWVLINTEGIPFWTINGEGFHRSDPEKSIIVFTNQRLQRFMSPLQTALTWAYWWTIILWWCDSVDGFSRRNPSQSCDFSNNLKQTWIQNLIATHWIVHFITY